MLRIGGRCGIVVVAAIVAGSAYALPRFGTVNIYELESAEALPRIAQHSRELQVILSGEILTWLMLRYLFEQTVLKGRDRGKVAEETGIAGSTLRLHVSNGYQVLGALARSLPSRTFHRLFQSVCEHVFGDEVTARELTAGLFGRYDRRATQTIAVKWIPAVRQGKIDLPMPRKRGKSWVWTKGEAEAWRQWFAEGKPETARADVR